MSDSEIPRPSSWIIRPDELQIENDSQIGGRQVAQGRWKNSLVAVKILHEQAEPSALHARGELWSSLQHANVLQVFGVSSRDADPAYVITQFQPEGNVNHFLKRHPKMDREKIVFDVALGLQYLHARGVVHGSLQPTNILMTMDGTACLADYGMIELQTGGSNGHRYFSPEAWKGTISRSSDVFAWAMSTLEIFTSTAPWGILSERQIFRMVVQQDIRPDRPDEEDFGLTDHIWGVMEKCWQQNSRQRPTSDNLIQLLQINNRNSTEFGRTSYARVEDSRRSLDSRTLSVRSQMSIPPSYESSHHPNSAPPTMSKFRATNIASPHEHHPHPPRPRYVYRGSETASILSSNDGLEEERGPPSQNRRWLAPSPSIRTSSSGRSSRSATSAASTLHRLQNICEGSQSMPSTPSPTPAYFSMPPRVESPYEKRHPLSTRSVPSEYSESTVSLHASAPSIRSVPSTVGTATAPKATLLVGALLSEVKDGRKPEVIDPLLLSIQELGLKSDKGVQRLTTAGAIPTLILLLKTRAVDGIGLEIVLVTLGILTHDPISANTIYRTSSTSTLIEIFSTAQSEKIATLAVWCLARICRNTEIANGLLKQNLGKLLVNKGLRGGWQTARMAAWCLGALIRSDVIADMLADIGLVPSLCEHMWRCSQSANASPEDYSAAIYAVARMSRSVKIAKALAMGGCVELLAHCLNTAEDPGVLLWSARAVGCLMRPNSSDMAKVLLDAGVARGLARLPSTLPSEEVEPLGALAFAIQRFSCAEWGGGTRKALVDAGVVDSLLAALRTAADEPYPQVHIELANAIALLGDVGGTSIRKEIVNAGGIEILKRVGGLAARADVAKACNQAATSITGNVWSRNAASAKAALAHEWSGGCPDYLPGCPVREEEEHRTED
ncbi:hypothetical protein B0H19DRAFT_1253057 [Mycena capillaripes]|nr:hypothetical protein B0H19DRAFT_1253057 [Mycena capillaripes]